MSLRAYDLHCSPGYVLFVARVVSPRVSVPLYCQAQGERSHRPQASCSVGQVLPPPRPSLPPRSALGPAGTWRGLESACGQRERGAVHRLLEGCRHTPCRRGCDVLAPVWLQDGAEASSSQAGAAGTSSSAGAAGGCSPTPTPFPARTFVSACTGAQHRQGASKFWFRGHVPACLQPAPGYFCLARGALANPPPQLGR